jgi:hypothetical protein
MVTDKSLKKDEPCGPLHSHRPWSVDYFPADLIGAPETGARVRPTTSNAAPQSPDLQSAVMYAW